MVLVCRIHFHRFFLNVVTFHHLSHLPIHLLPFLPFKHYKLLPLLKIDNCYLILFLQMMAITETYEVIGNAIYCQTSCNNSSNVIEFSKLLVQFARILLCLQCNYRVYDIYESLEHSYNLFLK